MASKRRLLSLQTPQSPEAIPTARLTAAGKKRKDTNLTSASSALSATGTQWNALGVTPSELRIDLTLKCGQSFRWASTAPDEWTSDVGGHLITLRQTESDVLFRVHPASRAALDVDNQKIASRSETGSIDMRGLLSDYFRLSVNLTHEYDRWQAADVNFRRLALPFRGIRMLRQDPVENVFSFICASCNNIARITQMVNNLCKTYGPVVGQDDAGTVYYGFPTVAQLAAPDVETTLRQLGFGYRAKFIQQAAQLIMREHGPDWLMGLRHKSYEEAHAALLTLPGIGAKVADCICLMSLDKLEAIPVDTHVWQIAARDFGLDIQGKSLTPRIYRLIGDHFRQLYGPLAGWAHSVLFTAELKQFELRRGGSGPVVKVKRRRAAVVPTKADGSEPCTDVASDTIP